MPMEGRIERIEDGSAYGWMSQDETYLGVKKNAVFISASGVIATYPIEEIETLRSDLAELSFAREIRINLISDEPMAAVKSSRAIIAIQFEDESFPLLVNRQVFSSGSFVKSSTPAGLSIGRVSSDGVACVGASGKLFLKSGSNGLENMYLDESLVSVDKWTSLVTARKSKIDEAGKSFIQMFLPEKTSVLHWLSPYKASRGTPGYRSLMRHLRSIKELSPVSFDALSIFPDEAGSEGLYRSFDTHISTQACRLITEAFINKFYPEASNLYHPSEVSHVETSGDLGERFADDGVVAERVPVYKYLKNSSGKHLEVELLRSFNPENGNTGTMRHWRSKNYLIDRKVICFGGSSFERGDTSTRLSWWFSRIFREFRFVWSPELVEEEIESFEPDVVICQTVERFLVQVPKS